MFFFNDTAPTEIYTLSLHDALPILSSRAAGTDALRGALRSLLHACHLLAPDDAAGPPTGPAGGQAGVLRDRKSTRLNSSHANTSYAVFCLKKKNSPPPSARLT